MDRKSTSSCRHRTVVGDRFAAGFLDNLGQHAGRYEEEGMYVVPVDRLWR